MRCLNLWFLFFSVQLAWGIFYWLKDYLEERKLGRLRRAYRK